MEQVLELIERGRAGYVAAMGMGGVFAALVFLYTFIFALGKVSRFGKVRSRSPAAPPPGPPPPEPDNAQIAAAVAVALALSGPGRRKGVSVSAGGEEEPSAWKAAGRMAMMQPFVRPKKD